MANNENHQHGTYKLVKYNSRPGGLKIGRYCSFAMGVKIMVNGNHPANRISMYPPGFLGIHCENVSKERFGVTIGNDVWVGYEALVLPGAEIGDGCIVGARTVVAGKKYPPYSLIIGSPAVVKRRFSDSKIEELLKIAWWNWTDKKVRANAKHIWGTDIDAFIQKFGF